MTGKFVEAAKNLKEGNKMDKSIIINELNKLEIIGMSFFVGAGLLIFLVINLRIKHLKNTTKDEMEIDRLKRAKATTVVFVLFGQIFLHFLIRF